MKINIKLDHVFVATLNSLKKEYGEEFEKLNGFHNSNLDFTEFINGFVDEETVANATIDGNANASTKDICSLTSEMDKPHTKLLAFNKIFYELKKKYSVDVANRWLIQEYIGGFYMHDAPSSSFKPYCFSGDTKILTKDGIKPLEDICGTEVSVLNKNGGWEKASIESFGVQKLKRITLERYGIKKEIRVTGNHKWFVKNKKGMEIVQTDDLEIGMKIPYKTGGIWHKVTPSPFGVAHGFFTGDGDKCSHLRANFCGDKISLLPYFTPANIRGTEREYTTIGVPKYFKELPSLNESASYLYGWLSGYFSADGCVDEKGRCTIASVERKNIEFVRDVLCVLGLPVNEIRTQDRITEYSNGEISTLYILSLSSEYLKSDFFIRPIHKERFEKNKGCERKNRSWIVRSIDDFDEEEMVYCAVAPITHSFVLDNNILTHNCFAYDLDELVEKGLFFVDDFKSEAPKHLLTFTRDVLEFVSWTSNRTSGACGLPSFLIYSYYFWKKDVENKYFLLNPEYYRDQGFQEIIYGLNQPYLRVNQSAFTNITIMDRPYLEEMFGGRIYPDGTYVIDYIDEIIEYQKAFMEAVSKTRESTMFTFPVLTYSLLYKDGKFVDEEFARWCSDHNTDWCDSNFFTSGDITSLSSCCRLINDYSKLDGFINSIGGSALKIGSVKVNTINLARIAYESEKDEELYINVLKLKLDLCIKALDVVRDIISRNIEKGLLPNYTYGLIDLKKQYNTIGINGMYEALDYFGYIETDDFGNKSYSEDAIRFSSKILDTINKVKDFYKFDYSINVEAVPAERCASILYRKDQLLFGVNGKTLYANQWIPLDEKCRFDEKIKLGSILDKKCGGGQIGHFNIDSDFTSKEQAWQLLNKIANSGVIYFAFNKKINICEHGHAFVGTDICPKCGGVATDVSTRIVGFLTPRSAYSTERKKEFDKRYWFKLED